MCKECGHVQILDIIDSSTLWDDYTYHSGQTKGIIEHFEEIAETVFEKYKPLYKKLSNTNTDEVDIIKNKFF